MSADLTWELLKKNNSFIVKRGKYIFSAEPRNLANLNAFKFSSLANPKSIGVEASGNTVTVTVQKKSAQHKPAKSVASFTSKSGTRRIAKTVTGVTKKGYRKDLEKLALARVALLVRAKKAGKPMKTHRVSKKQQQ